MRHEGGICEMNHMTKKRVGMVLAFSLTLTGAAAYIGIQQGNTDKTEDGRIAHSRCSRIFECKRSGGAGCDGAVTSAAV